MPFKTLANMQKDLEIILQIHKRFLSNEHSNWFPPKKFKAVLTLNYVKFWNPSSVTQLTPSYLEYNMGFLGFQISYIDFLA